MTSIPQQAVSSRLRLPGAGATRLRPRFDAMRFLLAGLVVMSISKIHANFPAIAALRLIRACAFLNGWKSLPVVPLLTIGATFAAAGEACGYLFGAGGALLQRTDEELDRLAGVIDAERSLLLP